LFDIQFSDDEIHDGACATRGDDEWSDDAVRLLQPDPFQGIDRIVARFQ
jgi:hypothetical protein